MLSTVLLEGGYRLCQLVYFFLLIDRDVALYALGIGACGREAVDADELKYVYNENGQEYIEVLYLEL